MNSMAAFAHFRDLGVLCVCGVLEEKRWHMRGESEGESEREGGAHTNEWIVIAFVPPILWYSLTMKATDSTEYILLSFVRKQGVPRGNE